MMRSGVVVKEGECVMMMRLLSLSSEVGKALITHVQKTDRPIRLNTHTRKIFGSNTEIVHIHSVFAEGPTAGEKR